MKFLAMMALGTLAIGCDEDAKPGEPDVQQETTAPGGEVAAETRAEVEPEEVAAETTPEEVSAETTPEEVVAETSPETVSDVVAETSEPRPTSAAGVPSHTRGRWT